MKKGTSLAKYLVLIRSFYTQALLQVDPANARPQQLQGHLINRTGVHTPLSDAPRQISIRINGFVIAGVLCYGGWQVRGIDLLAPITERI